jgi:outer membrane protein assembly factor BamE (lipoprotein component of BamABCDE complex)
MKALLTLICAALFLASGCATRPPLKQATLDKITEGQSNRADVEHLLGPPDDSAKGANRKTLVVYGDRTIKRKPNLWKDEFNISFLRAFFLYQADDVLEKKFVSHTSGTATTGFGVRTLGKPVTDEQLAQIHPILTRGSEAIEILGPPFIEELTIDGYILRRWAFVRQTAFSKTKTQIISVLFDSNKDVVRDFLISDNVPADKKKP